MQMSQAMTISDQCVGQVLGSFGGGGAQRLAYNLAIGVGARGGKSLAIALRQAGHYAEDHPAGVTLVALEAQRKSPIRLLSAALRLRRLVTQERIQVLHVHGTASLPFVILATFGLRHRVKVVFTWQDSERVLTETGWRRRQMIWALNQCARVSGSSRSVVKRLEAGAGLNNVGIFHGGVPVVPAVGGSNTTCPSILWLGRMVPPKDPEALIRAAATLRDEGIAFSACLVGEPMASTRWYFDQLRSVVNDLNLSERVRLAGFVPDAEMPGHYVAAHIGVQTSRTEGLSIALMEQMMAGLAIVATDVGDTSAAIQHEVNGLLIPPSDDAALVSALRRVLGDPQLRRRLGHAAHETAVRHFSLEAMTTRAIQEYEQLARSR